MSKFKVGDLVMACNYDKPYNSKYTEKIIGIYDDDRPPYELDNNAGRWSEKYLTLVEEKPKPKFKVGDKVRCLINTGATSAQRDDIVIITNVNGNYITFKNNLDQDGFTGYTNWFEPVLEEKHTPITNTIITDIKDEAQHKRVQEKLFSMGNDWIYKGLHNFEKSHPLLTVDDKGIIYMSSSIKNNPERKHITASEFLGEEPSTLTDLSPKALELIENGIIETGSGYYGKSVANKLQELHNYKMPEVKGANKTNMNNIVSFFNDLTVSAEDKELRKAWLKDENLNWTGEAHEIVKNLEAKELGYKNYEELVEKVSTSSSLSSFEVHALFTKYYAKLLDTAKKFNKRDEKKAK